MARSTLSAPGFDGPIGKYPRQVGIQFPGPYIEYVENKLREMGIDMSFQNFVKVAVVNLMPVPGTEQETELYVKRVLGVTIDGQRTFGTSAEFSRKSEDAPMFSGKADWGDNQTFFPENINGEKYVAHGQREKEAPEQVVLDTEWKAVVESKKGGVFVFARSIDDTGEVLLNNWTHKEFYRTAEFFSDQSKALAVLKYEELGLDQDDLADAIETAMMKAFPDYTK